VAADHAARPIELALCRLDGTVVPLLRPDSVAGCGQ